MRLFQKRGWWHVEVERNRSKALKTKDYNEAVKICDGIYGKLKPPCAYCGGEVGLQKQIFCTRDCAKNYNDEMLRYGDLRKNILDIHGNMCCLCHDTGELHIHHIDGNGIPVKQCDRNNSPENLVVLCAQCHRHEHAKMLLSSISK